MYIIILLAVIMAIFGIVGFRRGIWPEIVSLIILLVAFVIVERNPQRLIGYMNALYIGFQLVLKSGLNDLSAGDLDSAAAKLRSVERPFQGGSQGFALLAIMVAAAVAGYALGKLVKSGKSPIGGSLLGLLNGYILSAAFLPWLSGLSARDLPVPFIRPGDGLMLGGGSQAAGAAQRLTLPPVLDWLTLRGGLPLVLLLALLFVFAVWRMRPKKTQRS